MFIVFLVASATVLAASTDAASAAAGESTSGNTETTCIVSVAGLPASQHRYHRLVAGGRQYTSGRSVQVPTVGAVVRLEGPHFGGAVRLTAASCAGGPVELSARPHPATLDFRCPPVQAVVSCKKCPGWEPRPYLVGSAPDVPMEGMQRDVVFVLRAPGHERADVPVTLRPGNNRVRASMRALAG